MASRSAGNVAVRFSVENAEVVRQALKGLGADGEKALKQFDRSAQPLPRHLRLVSDASGEVSQGMQQMAYHAGPAGRLLSLLGTAGLAAGAALGAFALTFRSTIGQFAAFEQGMRNVQAVSGATEAEFDALSDAALRASISTRFNPSQTTQALYALASSGQTAREQMATLPAVLNLAEAGQADLGKATELLTGTLNQFNLDASESARVADVMVASIGASAQNVDRLQVSFRNAGPTAAALGQSLEGTAAALGILTTQFNNGQRAGTGLRAVLNELPKKADDLGLKVFDASGKMRPLAAIIADMEQKGITATAAVRLFGAEAGPSLAALLTKGSAALRDMEGRMESTGQAARVAAGQLNTLQGDWDSLISAIQVASVAIGKAESGMARTSLQTVTNLIRLWAGYGDTLGDAREQTELLAAAIETIAVAGGSLLLGRFLAPFIGSIGIAVAGVANFASGLTLLNVRLAATAMASRAVAGAMAFFGGPIGFAVTSLAGGLYLLSQRQDEAARAAETHAASQAKLKAQIEGVTQATAQQTFNDIQTQIQEARTASLNAEAEVTRLRRVQEAARQQLASDPITATRAGLSATAKLPGAEAALEAARAQVKKAESLEIDFRTALAKLGEVKVPAAAAGGIDIETDAIKKKRAAVKELIAELEFERDQLGRSATEQQVEANLRRAGAEATDTQRARIRDLTLELQNLRAASTPALTELADNARNLTAQLDSGLAGALRGAASEFSLLNKSTDSVGDRLKNFALRLADVAIQAMVLKNIISPLAGSLSNLISGASAASSLAGAGGGLGGIGSILSTVRSILPFADGGVIDRGNVVPFADGGVVTRPAAFPLAGGRTGLMAEAGYPEGILPLGRTRGGKLGVHLAGGNAEGGQGGGTLRIETVARVDRDGNIRSYVEGISGVVAGQIVRGAAPSIASDATAAAVQAIPGQVQAVNRRTQVRKMRA